MPNGTMFNTSKSLRKEVFVGRGTVTRVTVKLQWEIFHSCYEPFLSDSDTERILKIDQHLPK